MSGSPLDSVNPFAASTLLNYTFLQEQAHCLRLFTRSSEGFAVEGFAYTRVFHTTGLPVLEHLIKERIVSNPATLIKNHQSIHKKTRELESIFHPFREYRKAGPKEERAIDELPRAKGAK